eukprot:CAMPEP_0197525622 /NCGR_PEP_ID=MMETSP1318-20131121/13474_1 /TAXON_ID=552666 /ORGANISM="Partenskyella glossopodia, Strain RCC365" /LENGTH=73 /DNA_ID=CAMNT_0043079237 /DNA_START=27 /DNA_END=245 /DNA_ORIENTATION=+
MSSEMGYKIEEVLKLAREAATEAGDFVKQARLANFKDVQNSKQNDFKTKSNSTDVVTETDQKSEAMIAEAIRK